AAFENAIKVHAAIGGSTNAMIHLPAIAHELGWELKPELFDRILEPEYTPQRKERFVCIIHCVIIAVQVLLLVCYSHYQPLMLIY
ncbi:dihydroxy-acid dehydratase, partial [Salmonella enterica subsp. enterica serovar Anatum]|nr:dihydroxy-acid dehydratase [Salmonella enterica subsp. enterica serovar Anatum]